MKLTSFLPLVAGATALVLPDPDVMGQIAIESKPGFITHTLSSKIPSKDEVLDSIKSTFDTVVGSSKNAIDDAIECTSDIFTSASAGWEEDFSDVKSWVSSRDYSYLARDGPPHHGPPHDGPPHHKPGHGKPPHRRNPHHPHKKSNKTVYELISESKYTTKLAGLIKEDPYLVDLLNGTTANFTIFAPTDSAFEKIPKHAPKPSKEFIQKLLAYHISAEFYPAGRVLVTRTVPTLLEGEYLSEDPKSTPQRLSTNIGLRGLTVNFYSRIVAVDIFGTNGVIHGVDSILAPPFSVGQAISAFPGEFSTLELGLVKTGLYAAINDTTNHLGGTFFAPSNFAFQKLGPRANAFLFSSYGQKYLKALLKYHVVANQTLYSDAYYKATSDDSETLDKHRIPKGLYHVDLPTLLHGKSLSIDIGRYGRLIDVRINAFQSVAITDGIAKDGVLHVVSNVIIPPKNLANGETLEWDGGEIEVDDLKERLGLGEDEEEDVEAAENGIGDWEL